MVAIKLTLSLSSPKKDFVLGNPISVSRPIKLIPQTKSSNAFYLPPVSYKTFELNSAFIGDVTKGGSCNVNILNFSPHGITHVESSAHILEQNQNAKTIEKIAPNKLIGIVYLIDLTSQLFPNTKLILKDIIETKLKSIDLPVSMIALKTFSSELSPFHDFSGKDFLALSPSAAELLHDFRNNNENLLSCLILDLPSTDPEQDGGRLIAHRKFFGIPLEGYKSDDIEGRLIIELAYFNKVKEGYYYCVIAPPKFQTDAMATDVLFFPLIDE